MTWSRRRTGTLHHPVYMLFVLNSAGVPSVARFVRLAPAGPPPPPPPTCSYALDLASWDNSATGGDTGCKSRPAQPVPRTAVSDSSWLVITDGASGNGPGLITARLEANTGPARVGHITVQGQVFEARQGASHRPRSERASRVGDRRRHSQHAARQPKRGESPGTWSGSQGTRAHQGDEDPTWA